MICDTILPLEAVTTGEVYGKWQFSMATAVWTWGNLRIRGKIQRMEKCWWCVL